MVARFAGDRCFREDRQIEGATVKPLGLRGHLIHDPGQLVQSATQPGYRPQNDCIAVPTMAFREGRWR